MKLRLTLLLTALMIISCQPEKKQEGVDLSCKQDYSEYSLINNQNREFWKQKESDNQFVTDAGNLGYWELDENDLPLFNFTASLPIKTNLPSGTTVDYPVDPWFMIGNYRFNCFIHASGGYQILSMERAIARLNGTGKMDSASCHSVLTVGGKSYHLSGLDSEYAIHKDAKKTFGPGYGSFSYTVYENLIVTRTLATLPSKELNKGYSALLINIDIENNGETEMSIAFQEGFDASYKMAMNVPGVEYPISVFNDKNNNRLVASFQPKTEKQLMVGRNRSDYAVAEGFPPKLFLQVLPSNNGHKTTVKTVDAEFYARLNGELTANLNPGESTRMSLVIGYLQGDGTATMDDIVNALQPGAETPKNIPPFRKEWREQIPAFEEEQDLEMRTEMQWHAAMLETMANYNEEYDETYLPQGNIYEYGIGVSCCLNDISVHSLPLNYYNPDLAKSIIRYTLKHADSYGFMFAADMGARRMAIGSDIKSNSYPYTFFALSEYFKATQDANFLKEEISPIFCGEDYQMTVLDMIERLVLFSRDELGVGVHGLPKLLDSDWNDSFYYFFKDYNFHYIFRNAESHMNAVMFVQYFEVMEKALKGMDTSALSKEQREKLAGLTEVLFDFKMELLEAIKKDLGDNSFMYRAYIKDVLIGKDNLFLEPQIFAIGIEGLTKDQRLAIWNMTKEKLWDGEMKGARQNEKGCETEFKLSQAGSRENGGFWYSLNGPLLVNLIEIDKEAAEACLNKMTMMQHGKDFPDYWPGMWSGPDSFDSSLLETEGITGSYLYPFPVFCSHAHAWPLWGYFRINEYNSK